MARQLVLTCDRCGAPDARTRQLRIGDVTEEPEICESCASVLRLPELAELIRLKGNPVVKKGKRQ